MIERLSVTHLKHINFGNSVDCHFKEVGKLDHEEKSREKES